MEPRARKRKTLFIVDDNLTNLNIARDILSKEYNVLTIPSANKMFEMLEKTLPDIILLDVEMPDITGYDAIKMLKENASYRDIPVIFITVRGDNASELYGLTLGAVDYISKPFTPQLLLKRVEIHAMLETQKVQLQNYNENLLEMVNTKAKEISGLHDAIICAITELVECRDYTAGGHIVRTRNYLRIMLDAMINSPRFRDEVKDWKFEPMVQSCKLHDLGKIAVNDSILNKRSKLTKEEFDEIKSHAVFGAEVIEKLQSDYMDSAFLEYAKIFAKTHHEKWNGTGYPNGLKEEEIPLQGRIMAIADVYDALISERPYKKPLLHSEAVEIIRAGSGTHFDPNLVELFLKRESEFERAAKF